MIIYSCHSSMTGQCNADDIPSASERVHQSECVLTSRSKQLAKFISTWQNIRNRAFESFPRMLSSPLPSVVARRVPLFSTTEYMRGGSGARAFLRAARRWQHTVNTLSSARSFCFPKSAVSQQQSYASLVRQNEDGTQTNHSCPLVTRYESMVAAGSLLADPAQGAVIAKLSELRARMKLHHDSLGSFFAELDEYNEEKRKLVDEMEWREREAAHARNAGWPG